MLELFSVNPGLVSVGGWMLLMGLGLWGLGYALHSVRPGNSRPQRQN